MNDLIDQIIKKYYIDEYIGSYLIQRDSSGSLIENSDILNAVNKIISDINSKEYLRYKIKNNADIIKELCLSNNSTIYSLTYHIDLFWINYLKIFIIEDHNYYNINGIPYIKSEEYTTVQNNRFETNHYWFIQYRI